VRSLYKDLVWLMNRNSLIERDALKRKASHFATSFVTVDIDLDVTVLCYEAYESCLSVA
jgi:hypothetical protein